jgi:hypothetical protein
LTNFTDIVEQLKRERNRVQQQLTGLNAALAAFAGVYNGTTAARRKMSAAGRARIAAAQRARWAKVNEKNNHAAAKGPRAGKRTMSLSARKKIAAAQRARWAKVGRKKAAA